MRATQEELPPTPADASAADSPDVVTWAVGRRLALIAQFTILDSAIYLVLNRFPAFAPSSLPLTPIDAATPFLVWTIWPYELLMAAGALFPLFVRRRGHFLDLFAAALVSLTLSTLVWGFLPTAYPRPLAPMDEGLSAEVYRLLVTLDTPASAFPSGHIMLPALGCWAITRERRAHGVIAWTVLLLLAPSVLTTKQHYLWDIAGGLLVATIGAVLGPRLRQALERRFG